MSEDQQLPGLPMQALLTHLSPDTFRCYAPTQPTVTFPFPFLELASLKV